MRHAKIYSPAKTAMQSGKGKANNWVVEILPEDARFIDPIMGWTGTSDTTQQLKLKFDSLSEAEDYAKRKGLHYKVTQPKKPSVKIQAYSDNFV